MIYTPFIVSNMVPFLDHHKGKTASYVLTGGTVNGDVINMEDFPRVNSGDHFIGVFGPSSTPDGIDSSVLNLEYKFEVKNGKVILKHQAIEQGQITQPEISMSLNEFRSELSKCNS